MDGEYDYPIEVFTSEVETELSHFLKHAGQPNDNIEHAAMDYMHMWLMAMQADMIDKLPPKAKLMDLIKFFATKQAEMDLDADPIRPH